jgi:hypothetical protein
VPRPANPCAETFSHVYKRLWNAAALALWAVGHVKAAGHPIATLHDLCNGFVRCDKGSDF